MRATSGRDGCFTLTCDRAELSKARPAWPAGRVRNVFGTFPVFDEGDAVQAARVGQLAAVADSHVDPGRLARLLADLDHRRFAVRERASRELERLGHPLGVALRRALAGRPLGGGPAPAHHPRPLTALTSMTGLWPRRPSATAWGPGGRRAYPSGAFLRKTHTRFRPRNTIGERNLLEG